MVAPLTGKVRTAIHPIPEGTDMQSAACLEWERTWRRLAPPIAFVAWCSIALTIIPSTCDAQNESPNVSGSSEPNPAAVYVVEKPKCDSKAKDFPSWSESELWAWSQICGHLTVDFDEREANGLAHREATEGTPEHDRIFHQKLGDIRKRPPGELAADPSRRLTGDFLSQIFGAASLRPHTWPEPIRLAGFNTDRFVIDTASLKSLDIQHAHIGRFMIHNAVVDGGLRLENISSGNIKVDLVTAKHILLNKVSVSDTNSASVQLRPHQPPFKEEERDGKLLIDTVRLEDRLAILGGRYDAIEVAHMKVDDLFIYYPKWTGSKESNSVGLSITESVDTGVFTLQVKPESLPKRIKFNQFIFANAYLGSAPMPVINAIDADAQTADEHPDLEPYTLIAKSYADRGEKRISDQVLIARNERDWHLSKALTVDFAWLTISRYLAVYGFHPELGFAYIVAFVILGWAIFWCASDRLAEQPYKPKSKSRTLLLALDSVIPGIQLDKRNLTVRYHGWPQLMLYLLRALGAALFFIAYFFLQKKLFG
jgi:hypothetical protein